MADLMILQNRNRKNGKRLLRDLRGTFDLSEGEVICMRGVDNIVEIFKVNEIFQFFHPDTIDPERKKPNMKSFVKKINKGTSNTIIARAYLQPYDIIDSAPIIRSINKDTLKSILKKGRDCLLDCENAYIKFASEHDKCISKIQNNNIGESELAFLNFPSIENIDELTTSFLINAKRFIGIQIEIFNCFFNTNIEAPRTDKIIKWLEQNANNETDFINNLQNIKDKIKEIIDLRNAQEHPSSKGKLLIEDFKLSDEDEISIPNWRINDSNQKSIKEDMKNIIGLLLFLSEIIVINSVFAKLSDFPLPLKIEQKPLEKINPLCPVKYVLLSECSNNSSVKVGNQIGFEDKFEKV